MRSALGWLAALATCSAAMSVWAVEGDGLVPSKDTLWPRWQSRLAVGTAASLFRPDPMNIDRGNLKLAGATLLGDYYFTRSLPRLGDSGGFRATSGVFLGSRSGLLLSTGSATGLGGRAFNVERRSLAAGSGLNVANDPSPDASAVPYLGLGYTGLSSKGGWGFSADLGLMALAPGGPGRR